MKITILNLLHLIVGIGLCAEAANAASLAVTYNNSGLATLRYGNITLVDTAAFPGDADWTPAIQLRDSSGTVTSAGGNGTPAWDPANHKLTNVYGWGSVITQFTQSGDTLTLTLTVHNTSAQTFVGGVFYPLTFHFPASISLNSGEVQKTNTDGPSVLSEDFGGGVIAAVNEDVVQKLYIGFHETSGHAGGPAALFVGSMPMFDMNPSIPAFNRSIAPGGSDTYTISLRFAPSGTTAPAIAPDIFQKYGQAHPMMVNWNDRRPIGVLMVGSPNGSASPAGNPRNYLVSDGVTDATSPAGRNAFHQKIIDYATRSAAILKNFGAQGMITWDIEGQPSTSQALYFCDPRIVDDEAPEMATIVNLPGSPYNGMKIVDAYFKIFRDNGLRVGVCARPQVLHWQQNTQDWITDHAEMVRQLDGKISYANQRWGATLFYVDSNDQYDADVFKQVQADNPGVLLIPENQHSLHFAYGAPYNDPRLFNAANADSPITPAEVKAIWPTAFQTIYMVDNALDQQYQAQFVQAVKGGDVIMFEAWYSDPAADNILRAILQLAHAGDMVPPGIPGNFRVIP